MTVLTFRDVSKFSSVNTANKVINRNNGKIWTWEKPVTLYTSLRRCLGKLCKNVIAIEFGLLCQKLWGMLAVADVFIEHSCSL